MSQSVMFSPYSHTAKCTNPVPSDSVIQTLAVPGLSHVIDQGGNRLKSSVEDRHKYGPTF